HHRDELAAVLDAAREFNESCSPKLEEEEVLSVVQSAWNYTERGQNRFGQHGAWFPTYEVASMLQDQDVFFLLAFLRAKQGLWAIFMCSNGLAEKFSWSRKRLAAARSRLIELGYLCPLRHACRGSAALFRWCDR